MLPEKVCTKCGKGKNINDFYRKKSTQDGLRPECKECTNEVNKAYREKNREKVAKINFEYKRDNREEIRKKNAIYREENREEIRERMRRWIDENRQAKRRHSRNYYYRNREKAIRASARWAKNNPLKRAMSSQRRRSRIESLPFTFTEEEWVSCLTYFNNGCAYCGKNEDIQQDHFIPVSKGGGYVKGNIIPACGSCNAGKRDRDFLEWYVETPNYSKDRVDTIYEYLEKHQVKEVI